MEIDPSRWPGLTEDEARRRLIEDGLNELPSSKPRGMLGTALDVVKEPMFLLLVACGGLYLALGDWKEALLLLGFVFLIMAITFIQERRTERALEALRDLSSPRALVIRDGQPRRIAGRDVARGDILMLSEGDRVPADAVVLDGVSLAADESLLTGESVPVRKSPNEGEAPEAMGRPGGDDLPFLFSGTMVVQGRGVARALSTGMRTEIGRIGKALQSLNPEDSTLKKETGRLVRNLAILGAAMCAVVVVTYGITNGNDQTSWTQGALAGITLAMAMLPEEFPVVLTIFLALGAWRISRSRVLTRRIPAIETLGAATVLCTDKTGTLTENRMTVTRLWADGAFLELDAATTSIPEAFHPVVEYGVLASQRDPVDPMESAIDGLGDRALTGTEHDHSAWELQREYPLSRALLALSRVWRSPDGSQVEVATKGAPEAIFDLCHLPVERREALTAMVLRMADDGLRVLGVARAKVPANGLPEGQHDFDFQMVGLLGLADPVRATVPAAIQECYGAGIRVVMITGDYPGTARSIARTIGFQRPDAVITGPELDAMTDDELKVRICDVDLFARVVPEQKLRLVQALQANGEVVAMTGDGVNDAPALKAAHIGIAMGGRGTDVAREAASLVLLDDDFTSIVAAVRLGRRIFDNLQKAMAYIFAIHVPIAGLSLIPVLAQWPLLLLPVHVVFLELIIDPSCTLVFEAEDAENDVMKRPPRRPDAPLFGRRSLLLSLLQGLCVLGVSVGVFLFGRDVLDAGENGARGLAFATLIAANLSLIVTNRSWTLSALQSLRTPNRPQWWVVAGGLSFLCLVLFVPFLKDLFKVELPGPQHLVGCIAAGVSSIFIFEAFKAAMRRRTAMSLR
jgi:Ca2+-transporting ATPase